VATLRKRSNGYWQTRGRPPSGYRQLNLSNPEQLACAILKILFMQKIYDLALNQPDTSHIFLHKPPQDF
jgi:hypothetical protein